MAIKKRTILLKASMRGGSGGSSGGGGRGGAAAPTGKKCPDPCDDMEFPTSANNWQASSVPVCTRPALPTSVPGPPPPSWSFGPWTGPTNHNPGQGLPIMKGNFTIGAQGGVTW